MNELFQRFTFIERSKQRLFPHQRKWVEDKSRFKIANKSRQCGFSTCLAFEAVNAAAFDRVDCLIVSASERNAQEVLLKARRWADVAKAAGLSLTIDSDSKSEMSFIGGGKILSLSQNPATVRGFSGNVYLDEFAHHSADKAIYDAILPVASLGYSLRIVSTPWGQSGKFYEVWNQDARYSDFSRHEVDVYSAVKNGLALDVEAIRRNMDADSFACEYMCQFIDEATSYIPYSIIRPNVGDSPIPDGAEYFLGADIARKKDLSVFIILAKHEDRMYVKRIERMKNKSFGEQKAVIQAILQTDKIKRGAIDSTGLGMQLAEELTQAFPQMRAISFTNATKQDLATNVKRFLEERRLQIPDDRALIASIHAIQRSFTGSNMIRYDSTRDAVGHADEFWSLALALKAGSRPQMTVRQY